MSQAYAMGWDRTKYGMPVAPSELEFLDTGQKWARELARVASSHRSDRGVAYPYWDVARGVGVVAFTPAVDPTLRATMLNELSGMPLTERRVDYDNATLESELSKVSDLIDLADVGSIALSDVENRVVVTVTDAASPSVGRVRSASAAVAVEVGQGPRSDDTPRDGAAPPRGGKEILVADAAGVTHSCSAAVVGAGGIGYYLVTASHCSPPGRLFRAGGGVPLGSAGAYNLGNSVNGVFWTGTGVYMDCDCMAVGPISPTYAQKTFFTGTGTGSSHATFARTITDGEYMVGVGTCRIGYVSGRRCGAITARIVNPTITVAASDIPPGYAPPGYPAGQAYSRVLNYAVQSSVYSCEGDSGGAYSNTGNDVFMGVHSSSGPKGPDGFGNICTINLPGQPFRSNYSRGYVVPGAVGVGTP